MKITYIVLAKSIPEYSKKNDSLFTCTIGYCPEMNDLIRVYPMPLKGMNRWDKVYIDVEKNKMDNRMESWKLTSYARYENWIGLDKDVQYLGKVDRNKFVPSLLKFQTPSMNFLNKNRKSIGIIPINDYRLYWDSNDRYANNEQFSLFQDVELADFVKFTKDSMKIEPRIYFKGQDGEHDISYNDWGVSMWYKNFSGIHPLNDAFRFLKNKQYALIGNLNAFRNSWICLDLY